MASFADERVLNLDEVKIHCELLILSDFIKFASVLSRRIRTGNLTQVARSYVLLILYIPP